MYLYIIPAYSRQGGGLKTLGLIDNRIEYQDLFRNTDVLLRKYYLHILRVVFKIYMKHGISCARMLDEGEFAKNAFTFTINMTFGWKSTLFFFLRLACNVDFGVFSSSITLLLLRERNLIIAYITQAAKIHMRCRTRKKQGIKTILN